MTKHKFKKGQTVLFDGLIATIERESNYMDGLNCYDLVSVANPELSCTAPESEISEYNGEFVDESDRLLQAKNESFHIMQMVGSITDARIGDCSFE